MPTWEETQNHIRSKFKLVVDEARWMGLSWRIPAEPEPVLQRERVELVQAFGLPHLLILCDVFPEDQMSPTDALAHNMTLAIGSLALTEKVYVLRHVLALDGLGWPELERSLEYVAHEAGRLRYRASKPAPVPPAGSPYEGSM
jgi:hypothetical protein